MYTRVLTFQGATDIDGGVRYLQEQVLPVIRDQHGYRGLTASADRAGSVFGVLSRWDSEADLEASDSALSKVRDESLRIVGGNLTVEHFERALFELSKPPQPGCGLFVTRVHMDPADVDDNVVFFRNEILPLITSQAGFCGLELMVDRRAGRGIVGSAWENRQALDDFAAGQPQRQARSQERGVHFDETTKREILLGDVK